jgi:hypothetical protein
MDRKMRVVFVLLTGLGLVLGLLGFLSPLEGAADWAISADARDTDLVPSTAPAAYLPSIYKNTPLAVPPYPNCRYGVVAAATETQHFDLVENLSVGWYMDFGQQVAPRGAPELEYVQLIHVSQDRGGEDTCGPDYGYSLDPPLTADGLGDLVAANPGSVWVVGNEPERIGQDDVCPQQYAQAYHDAYYFIKERDPTARVAVAGLVQVTPGRLQYLDIVRDTYQARYGWSMPVDVWTMHIYILPETSDGDAHIALGTDPDLAMSHSFNCADPDTICHAEHDDMNLFVEQVERMRRWMKENGYQDTPLLMTEYGINLPYHYPTPDKPDGRCEVQTCSDNPDYHADDYCFCDDNNETFHPERVADFMEATFNFLRGSAAVDPDLGYPDDGYRLVQQWMWYRIYTEPPAAGHASNLADPNDGYAMTVPAQRWHDYVANVPPLFNLAVDTVPGAVGTVVDADDTATVTLSGVVLNNGNVALDVETTATFYSDPDLLSPIGSAVFTGLGGCARHRMVLTTTWPSLSVGLHSFWFKVDSLGQVGETNENDNVGRGVVLIATHQLYLPLVARGE